MPIADPAMKRPITDVAKIRSFFQTTSYCFGCSLIVFGFILLLVIFVSSPGHLRIFSVLAPYPITGSRYGDDTEMTRRRQLFKLFLCCFAQNGVHLYRFGLKYLKKRKIWNSTNKYLTAFQASWK